MTWTITQGEEGYLISRTIGHMSEPWAVGLDQTKAMHILEILEFGDALMLTGIQIAPPVPVLKVKITRKRRNT